MVETGTIEESTPWEVSPKHRYVQNYTSVIVLPCVCPIGNEGFLSFHGADPFPEIQNVERRGVLWLYLCWSLHQYQVKIPAFYISGI